MSRFVRFSFFAGVSLATFQFLLVLSGGSIMAGLFWGVVPVWFWATFQKLKANSAVGKIEGIAAYAIVLYGALLALFSLLFLFCTVVMIGLEPEVLQAAVEQQPNYDDFSDEELEAIEMIMQYLPILMPVFGVVFGLMSTSYIGYGLAVVRKHSN